MTIGKIYELTGPRTSKYAEVACINPNLIIGLELETENCDAHGVDAWNKIAAAQNFQVKTDGSLRGVAYEFISRPMRSECALGALRDFLEAAKFDARNYSDRCSVHVHVNCIDLELENIASLALLYTTMEEILFEFVGGSRDTNIYCIPWNQCRQHLDLINRVLSDPSNVLKRWNKYTALNLIPLSTLGTVEFRQMHGTADINKLTTWINIIGALFKEAKTRELKDLITEIKSLNSTSQYEAFFYRVLAGQLPYTGAYREKLEEGVIFAKYSLVSMEKKRGKPTATNTAAPRPAQIVNQGWLNPAAEIQEQQALRREVNPAAEIRFPGPRILDPFARVGRNRNVVAQPQNALVGGAAAAGNRGLNPAVEEFGNVFENIAREEE